VIYLDSTVFLNAAMNTGEIGGGAREIVAEVQDGKTRAATSALTYDEVFWVTKKHRGFEAALEAGKALLEMPNLVILPVDAGILWRAHGLSTTYTLRPRDAIHIACTMANGMRTRISDDTHFDRVKEVERRGLVGKSREPH